VCIRFKTAEIQNRASELEQPANENCDDAIIDWMLETIDARLSFLQALLTPMMQTSHLLILEMNDPDHHIGSIGTWNCEKGRM
jgi:hypothetical protein